MSPKDAIKDFEFFDKLSNAQLKELAAISRVYKYPSGSILYYENDNTDELLFLKEGLIKVYKVDKFDNEIFLYHIYKNNMISELSNINSDTIYCFSNTEFVENSLVLAVDYQKFKEKFLSKNVLTLKFINELIVKSHHLQCIINRELVFDSTAKVAFMLNNDLDMFNRTKRQDISFMLHIQPETLSRVLNRFKRNKIIDSVNGNIVILDIDQLRSTFRGIGL